MSLKRVNLDIAEFTIKNKRNLGQIQRGMTMKATNFFRAMSALALTVFGLTLALPAHAAVTATLHAGNSCAGANSANFSAGVTQQISVCITANPEPACSVSYRFVSANAGENGRFNLNARAMDPAFNFSNVPVVGFPIVINNTAAGDLGAGTATNTPVAASAAKQLVATLDVIPQATAINSSYVISLDAPFSKVFVDGLDGTCGGGNPTTQSPITASFTLNLFVAPAAPVFTSMAPPNGTFNTAYVGHTFTASGNPAPTFSITAGTQPPGLSLAGGGALTGTPTAGGIYNFTVTASNAAGSATQNVVNMVIAKIGQVITFANPGAQLFSASPLASGATTNAAGLVPILTTGTPTVCSVTGLSINFLTAGSCTINADQPGNGNFNAATQVPVTFNITAVAPGAPSVSGAAGNAQGTLTITPPANTGGVAVGTLTYAASCVPVGGTDTNTGTTSLSHVITGLANGVNYTCTVIATNAAGPGPASAASNVFQPAATPVTPNFTSGAALAGTVGTAIATFNITANGVPTPTISAGAAPTGLVFTSGGANTGTATITGTPTAAGTFNYTLSATSIGAPTPTVTQNLVITIAKANQTITFNAQATPSRPFAAGGTFAIAPVATTTSLLAITYVSTTPSVCSVSGTTVTIIAGGTCTISATQPGDANFNAATAVPQNVTITAAAQTITFGAQSARPFSASAQGISPLATASSGLAVTYTSLTGGICSVTGNTFTTSAIGNCTIAANQAGNANFTAAVQITQTFAITVGTQTISFGGLTNVPLSLVPITITPTATSGLPVTVTSTTPAICTSSGVNGTTITLVAIGTCTLQGTQAGNMLYGAAPPTTSSFSIIMPGAVSVTSSSNPAIYRSQLLLTANVVGTTPTGTVTFTLNTATGPLVVCAAVPLVSATAVCPIPARLTTSGTMFYQVAYSGDANNPTNTTSHVQLVNTNGVTLGVVSTPIQPVVGASVTLRATVAGLNLTNKVTFNENGTALPGCGAVSISLLPGATDIGVAACTIPSITAGNHNYVVTYPHTTDAGFEQVVVPISALTSAASDYTDMWWAGPSQNGWGVSITQHGRAQFIVLFVYDNNGNPIWYVLPEGTWNASNTAFTGALYQPTSSPFSSYNTANFKPGGATGASVGTATVTYTGPGAATLTYTINGISGTKSIVRQAFATDDGIAKMQTNDLWWAGVGENGWGMNIAQQGRVLFPVWYTYDSMGRTVFYTVPGGTWNGSTFTGDIYSTISSAWLGVNYNPAQFVVTKVGTMTLDFTDQSNAIMTYTINALTQRKVISRQPY